MLSQILLSVSVSTNKLFGINMYTLFVVIFILVLNGIAMNQIKILKNTINILKQKVELLEKYVNKDIRDDNQVLRNHVIGMDENLLNLMNDVDTLKNNVYDVKAELRKINYTDKVKKSYYSKNKKPHDFTHNKNYKKEGKNYE